MAIIAAELSCDEDLGRRVLLYASSVAPCLQSLDGERREDAVAVLRSIAADIESAPGYRVKSRTRGEWTTTYFSDTEITSIISAADRDALKMLCGGARLAGSPRGQFPAPHLPLLHMWPE